MELTAHATRSGDWWAVRVDEVPGLFTQAKRLDQVPAMVRDAASTMLGSVETAFEVAIVASIEGVDVEELSRHASASRAAASEAERVASEASRRAVEELRGAGLPVRDVGRILGISPQRVSMIENRRRSVAHA